MPSARIHEAVVKEINREYKMNELLLRIGTVSPDSWRNVEAGVKDKYLSHFWDFRVKEGQANNYEKFYLKYYNHLSNPFYFGYLIHLIVDQYWKTNIDPKYVVIENGVKGYKLRDGSFHNDENWFGYYDGLKLQRKLAEIYELGVFPINQDEIDGFYCEIDELNLSGLFGENGSLNYINTELSPIENDEESLIYDINDIINYIKETSDFVRSELLRLKQFKLDDDNKIKIAVDIDDTLLCTKELVKNYWNIFLNDNPDIDPTKEYKWGDEELARFWGEYREKLAFGDIKPNVQKILDILLANNYRVDLLSARPIDKYAFLIKKIVLFFEENGLHYNYLNLGFYSKKEFLKEHNYDILIDNEVRNVDDANDVGCVGILYGPHDDNYSGYQTSDWNEIPSIIECIIKKRLVDNMNFKIVLRDDYLLNRDKYLNDIKYLYLDDDNKFANFNEISRHLDFIFSLSNSLLVLLYDSDKLVCMVNGYLYNSISNDWCVFSLFTKKDYRGKGLGYKTLNLIVEEIKKYNPNMIVSGIEEDNISSIKVHESVGFKNSFMKWNEIDEGFSDNYLGYIIK